MWTRLHAIWERGRFAWERRRLDEEARAELDAHLELLTDRYRRQGLSPDQAYMAARRQFGNTAVLRQRLRDMNGIGWVEQGAQDLRYAVRQLRGNAAFTVVAVATLGLGIGGTTAVFSVVRTVLLAPLPYEQPGQLVRFFQQEPGKPDTGDVLAGTHFTYLRDHAASFEDVAALAHYSETGLDLVTDGRAHRLRVLRVSSGYFSTLRAQPRLGPGFQRDDDTGTRRVVLSDAAWHMHFRGDPAIVGTTIRLSAEAYEVAGIAPRGFRDPFAPDVAAWVPYPLATDTYEENNSLTAVGRLRQGVSLERARAELATLTAPLAARWPGAAKSAIVATPLHEELVAPVRGPVHLVFAAAGLVLLIACVNVANLLLVRGTGRVHEFAVRAALGSSRRRVARQLMVESLLLATLGGAAGVGLAWLSGLALRGLGRTALPRVDDGSLDGGVMAFALVMTALTAVSFGLAPMLRLARVSPADALRVQSRASTSARGLSRLRSALAAAQLALALTLIAGAGVLLASFHRLQQVDLGFDAERLLTFEVHLPTVRYDAARRARFHEELSRLLETIPGVSAAGGTSRLPATGSYHPWNTHIRSGPLTGQRVERGRFALQQRVVSGQFFAAVGVPLLAGRQFSDGDTALAPQRAIVSARLARQAFPDMALDTVVGQRIAVAGRELSIIGVVGDVALDAYGAATMVVYHAHRQFAGNRNWALTQVVATARPPAEILGAVREQVAALDPEVVVYKPASMTEVLGRSTARERFALVLMTVFAMVSLAFAGLGLYGVLAFSVRQRTMEIGIRTALGATATHIRALVFRQAAAVVAAGLAGGLAGVWLLGRLLRTLVFGIAPSDPRVLLATAVVLGVVAFVAAWLPAARASRIAPRLAMHQGQ